MAENSSKTEKRQRKTQIHFWICEEEDKALRQRMNEAGVQTLSAYMRRMGLEGKITRVNAKEIRSISILLGNVSSNVNQIARRANQTGSIYASDLDELSNRYRELHREFAELQNTLSLL